MVNTSISKLRELGLSYRKAEYIYGVAKLVTSGYDLEAIKYMDIEEAVKELKKIRGVGPWTAKLSLMASTGNLSLDLLEDKAVSKGLERAGLSKSDIEELMEKAREYIGLIMYLLALKYRF